MRMFEKRTGFFPIPCLLILILAGCGKKDLPSFQGYIEAEWLRVAAPCLGL